MLFPPAVLILSVLLPIVTAVPAGSSIKPPPPSEPVSYLSKFSDRRRPWIRLRDWAIEAIWGINHSNSLPKHGSIPTNMRDRYGSDVVLRFHLRHSDEAEAIASASRVLVLDVWAITSKYVDIRLAKDMV